MMNALWNPNTIVFLGYIIHILVGESLGNVVYLGETLTSYFYSGKIFFGNLISIF